jgi:hypothetical protein
VGLDRLNDVRGPEVLFTGQVNDCPGQFHDLRVVVSPGAQVHLTHRSFDQVKDTLWLLVLV